MAVDVDILRKHDLSSANQKFKPVILFENALEINVMQQFKSTMWPPYTWEKPKELSVD